jgi:hypothetical protein
MADREGANVACGSTGHLARSVRIFLFLGAFAWTAGAEEAEKPPAAEEQPATKPGEEAPKPPEEALFAADPQSVARVAELEGRATATTADNAKRQLELNMLLVLEIGRASCRERVSERV